MGLEDQRGVVAVAAAVGAVAAVAAVAAAPFHCSTELSQVVVHKR